MHTISRTTFTTVKTEGAILPADLLQRVADGRSLDGLTPADYHLAPSERLNEAINRSWNRCLGVWQSFDEQRNRLPAGDTGITLTRERWLLILFQELGYGRLSFQGKLAAGGVDYPISHAWEQVPIHLVSFRQDLDRRDPLAKRSPHSLMQEYLNRAPDSLWGFASNGLRLRILRDNASLTRAAYVEFDLEAMLTGELYADFSLLWLVCHQSRVEGIGNREIGSRATPDSQLPTPSSCWLERWSQAAAEQGTRALDALRQGVQDAISVLGRGFLRHPANGVLKASLKSGELSTRDYYRQLLRLVYRLIFLYVAEDRDLLLAPDAGPLARARYRDYYSVGRLRSLAEARRGGPHPDLYRTLQLVCGQLRGGCAALGLPALGGFLFSPAATPNLDAADLANHDLLSALRELAFTEEGRARRPVDYKNLGSEELGSVYESLLELHPQLNTDAGTFELASAAGSERKTTGSYYTAGPLISTLLDSALEPVIAARLEGKRTRAEQEQALLSIKVVDPASGSGHFLIMAAHRLARHLARIRTGDEEPSPAALRAALRDVVRHCIYGVDINPMAVELCKVALWMETLDPGKPLSFLDRNIQCGNSLIGATPQGLEDGIPDAAFAPVTGDDKAYCSEFKKLNKKEREQQALFTRDLQPWERLGNLAAGMAQLDATEDDTLTGVQRQEALYEELVRSADYRYGRLLADAWCAAFVWQKTKAFAYPITEQVFRQIERNPFNLPVWMADETERLREQYQFFHWHLAFPHVFTLPRAGEAADNETAGWCGGFDVACGNPPWERIKLQEQEFFATRDPEIAAAANKAARQRLIEALPKTNPALAREFAEAQSAAEAESKFVRSSDRFPLAGVGDVNTYALFAELARILLAPVGRAGIIVPIGIATDDTTKRFFGDIVKRGALAQIVGFENEAFIFRAVHHSFRFCILVMAGSKVRLPRADFVFFCRYFAQVAEMERHFQLSPDDIGMINPNTRTMPVFRTRIDADLTIRVYRNVPILVNELNGGNPWNAYYMRLVHLGDHAQYVRFPWQEADRDWNVSLYEAKLFSAFDHRYGTFAELSETSLVDGLPRELTVMEKQNPCAVVAPRYYVPNSFRQTLLAKYPAFVRPWLLLWRDVTSAITIRTVIAAAVPKYMASVSAPSLGVIGQGPPALLMANLNSIVLDYTARQKVGGNHLSWGVLCQLPILPPASYDASGLAFIAPRVLELVYTAWDMAPFAADLWADADEALRAKLEEQHEAWLTATGGHPWDPPDWAGGDDCPAPFAPAKWDEDRRALLRAELDAYYARLYGLTRDELRYILDPKDVYGPDFPGETFRVLKEKEERTFGEYRTRRLVLEAWDRLEEELGPVVVRNYREEMNGGQETGDRNQETGVRGQRLTESGPTSQVSGPPAPPAPPKFGAILAPAPVVKPAPVAEPEPDAGQRDLFGEPAAPSRAEPARAAPKSEPATPPLVVPVMPAPQGAYPARLAQVMALRKQTTPEAIGTLVAALGDPDANIRWLAGSVLQSIGGETVIVMLRAFVRQADTDMAREEAEKVLGKLTEGR